MAMLVRHMCGPRYATPAASPTSDGTVIFFEEYWLWGVAWQFFFLLGFGMFWYSRDLPGGVRGSVVFALPCCAIAIAGIPDLFLRRRHTFDPARQEVRVEGYALGRGRFARAYKYAELRLRVEWRGRYRGRDSHVILYYPDFAVSIGQELETAAAEVLRQKRMTELNLTPSSADPSPT